jgi:hypothetical protein
MVNREKLMSSVTKINYVELPTADLIASKRFFEQAFGWHFVDYGPGYSSFDNAGLAGGFFQSDRVARCETGSALVVLYSDDLEATLARVESLGGSILQAIFSFPGGRRFHFADPSGNEWAVWSDQGLVEE